MRIFKVKRIFMSGVEIKNERNQPLIFIRNLFLGPKMKNDQTPNPPVIIRSAAKS